MVDVIAAAPIIMKMHERNARLDRGEMRFEDVSFIALTNLYLFASYAYYQQDDPILLDGTYDRLCKYLYNNWDFLAAEGVWHVGELIQEGNLQAGTCIGVVYPNSVREIADVLIELKSRERVKEDDI